MQADVLNSAPKAFKGTVAKHFLSLTYDFEEKCDVLFESEGFTFGAGSSLDRP